jgi:hypothetical protein
MENFIKNVGEMELKVTNEKINQTQRNSLKADFMNSLVEMFAEKGIELNRTENGLVLKVEGKEHDLHFEIDAVVKGLDYDLVASIDEYNAKIADRNEKAIQLAKAKEKRLAEKSKSKIKKS